MSKRGKIGIGLLALLALMLPLLSINAQDVTKGSIAGVVRDATGGVVPAAKVTLDSPFGARTTTTSAAGDFVFLNLVVGAGYSLTAEKQGFAAAKAKEIAVRINQRSTVDLTLQVGTAQQTVEVVAAGAGAIDLATTTVGANIDESVYKSVAIGRNISSLMFMAPGVSDGLGTGAANPSINGASGLENMYIVNGVNMTDPGFGGFGTFSRVYGSLGSGVNFDFVQEIQVKSGGFEAQYGQALGGVINVITKSGGNAYHGSLYGYFQPMRLAVARIDVNQFVTNKGTYTHGASNYDFGADMGGYLKKDKLFWYGGINPQFNYSYRSSPKDFKNFALGTVGLKTQSFNYQGKLNYNLSSSHQLEGAVFGDPSSQPTNLWRSMASDDDLRASKNEYGSRTWTARYNGTFGQRWVLSANYSSYYNQFTETPKYNGYQIQDRVPAQEKTGSTVTRNGLGFLEGSEARTQQVGITSSHNVRFLGTHLLEYGYQYEHVPYDDNRLYTGPSFKLPNTAEFKSAAGQTQFGAVLIRTHSVSTDMKSPIVLQVTRGNYSDPATSTLTRYDAAFVQDSWSLGRHITVKPGLRWEQQAMAGRQMRYVFAGNWAPRLGVIVDPTGNRKTKMFFNYGRFFEKVPSDISVRAFSYESSIRGAWYKDQSGTIDLSPANYVVGGKLAPSGGPDYMTQVAGGTKAQYQNEWVGGYEHEFKGGYTLSSRFVYRNLPRILEDISGINVTQYLNGVTQQYYVANPSAKLDIFTNAVACKSGANCDLSSGFTFNNNGQFAPDGKPDGFPDAVRNYKSLELTLAKRMSNNWQIYTSYRLASLKGNFEGSFRNDNGQQDPNISSLFDFTNSDGLMGDQFKPGPLPPDRRSQGKLFSNYQFSEGKLKNLNLGATWNVQTGVPLSKFLAHPGYDNSGEVPSGGRGSLGRTPITFPFDLHADYSIKVGEGKNIKFVADTFNLFNSKRWTSKDQNFELDSTTANVDYMKTSAFMTPFRMRLAIRFEF